MKGEHTMQNNNMFTNYYQPYQQGTNQMYNNQATQVKMTELDPKDVKLLQDSNMNQFTLDVSEIDMIRAACPHRKNGQYTLDETIDGEMKCSICGSKFNMVQATAEEVRMKVKEVNDILQSTKAMHLEMPIAVLKEFMPIIEMLNKVPKLHEIATSTFQKYDYNVHQGAGNSYGFGMLANLMGGGFGMPMNQGMQMNPGMMNQGQPMYGQPMYGQPMYGQPMGNYNQQMQGQQPGVNPFGMQGGDPTMGQQVNQNGQMQNPVQPQSENGQKLESTKSYGQ